MPEDKKDNVPHDVAMLKVAIRTDRENDAVTASVATLDGKESLLMASISLSAMRLDKSLADEWIAVIQRIGMKVIEAGTGAEIVSSTTHDPSDLESKPQG